tara:strand:- start:290 stop:514 length:225 start_codon:yes stop_codon:yes gene_type:complete
MNDNIKKLLWHAYDLDQQGEPEPNIFMMGLFIAVVFARNLGYSRDRVYGELIRQWTEVDNQLGKDTMSSHTIDE